MMLFDPKDLNSGYTAEEIEKLFFIRKDLSDLGEDEKQALLRRVNALGLKDVRIDTVLMLLCIMHDARQVDQGRFLRAVFLPWHELRQKTKLHYERIGRELVRIGEFAPSSVEEAAHAANVYRNIISDLFDPYLSLIVACFQFKEGSFTTLEDADIGQGERTKYDYLLKRVNAIYTGKQTFLSGYNPRVRNAISHSGARGVTYLPDRVVFRNIKRATPPVVETMTWSFDELQLRVLQLLECIVSIEVAAEIFGLDCTPVIGADFETYTQFVLHAVPPELRARWRERHGRLVEKIRASQKVPEAEKQQALADVLFYNCGLRGMPCRGLRFSNDGDAVSVEVPAATIDTADDQHLRDRMLELPRYAVLARSVFGTRYDPVFVVETDDARSKQQLAVRIAGKNLDDYIEERAGLLDLLNDSKWFLSGRPFDVQVDFHAVEQAELAIARDPFPRKPREEA